MSEYLQEFRRRMTERGHKRVEVAVSAEHAELVRRVAKILSMDSSKAHELRQLLAGILPSQSLGSYKEWLAALPDE